MIKKLFSTKEFKDQISFKVAINKKNDTFYSDQNIHHFIRGFFNNNVYAQHKTLSKILFEQKNRHVVLELPSFAGKTTAAYMSAFIQTYSTGKNSLIIYPSAKKRDIAANFISKRIEEIYYHKFPSVFVVENDTIIKNADIAKPQLYVADVETLHSNILPNINQPYFWRNLCFLVIEDIDEYSEVFGSHCSYLFRRLFAKLSQYGEEYQLLCTNKPISNRLKIISEITGIKKESFEEIVNVNSTGCPQREIAHWYPPVEHIDFADDPGRQQHLSITVKDFFDELTNLIGMLSSIDEKNDKQKNYKCIVILWQKSFISKDDIGNITAEFSNSLSTNTTLIIGNNLDEIRYKLLIQHQLDMTDIDVLLIVGLKKPIEQYLYEMSHIGAEGHSIIFFNHQSPSLQYEAFNILRGSKKPSSFLMKKTFNIFLSNPDIITKHCRYLREEYPNISQHNLIKYFPKDFVENFNSNQNQYSGKFIYLNKNINFLPKEKRFNIQLYASSDDGAYKLELIGENNKQFDTLPEKLVRAYCYVNGKFVHNETRYLVLNTNHDNRTVQLKILEDYGRLNTYKIAEYEVSDTSSNNTNIVQEVREFNNTVKIIKSKRNITENIIAVKRTENFRDFTIDQTENSITSFRQVPLNIIELQFNCALFQKSKEENQSTSEDDEINEDNQTQINQLGYRILHTLSHLLLEAAKTVIETNVTEIKVSINTNTENTDDAEAFFSLYFIDLTGLNDDFLNYFVDGNLKKLMERAERILSDCPCEGGSWSCVSVDYCNLPGCPNYANLDKLGTLRLIGVLLARTQLELDSRERWKSFFQEWDIEKTGVNNIDRRNILEKNALMVMKNKGLINIKPHYQSRFMSWEEINNIIRQGDINNLQLNDISHRFTINNTQETVYFPGLPELVLYDRIFQERFHNYLNTYSGSKQAKFNSMLEYINWEDIDDPLNIPYIGALVKEGSSVWFAVRMMEFFADLDYLKHLRWMRENIAGLHLFFKLEEDFGYMEVFEKLKNGFDITKYSSIYSPIVERELTIHSKDSLAGVNKNMAGGWFLCLSRNNQLTNANRVSYYLRGRSDNERAMSGINTMLERNDPSVSHIRPGDIRLLANRLSDDYINDPQVVAVLRRVGLSENDGLLCEICASNCNLFEACMINGGRRIFRDILLTIYPKEKKDD